MFNFNFEMYLVNKMQYTGYEIFSYIYEALITLKNSRL